MSVMDNSTEHVIGLYQRHLGSGRASLGRMLGGVTEVSTRGPWIMAADGRRFLDFGGYGVFLLGHRHPSVLAAIHRQLETRPLASRVFLDPVLADAARALAQVSPDGLDYVHFVNSGTEATEAGLKLARIHGKDAIVTTRHGFHGKTLGALSTTANPVYQDPFRPLLPDTTVVDYGDLAAMREALAARAGRACVIVEPVQGEGGVVIPPSGYLGGVAAACDEFGSFLIVDEVQTGMGRLGSWWGVESEGVTPHVLLVGKGLSGGVVPVAAAIARAEVYEPFGRDPFLHSSTFGGSPLACAAAQATVRAMLDNDIVSVAAKLGDQILQRLRLLPDRGLIADIRGRGLLIGVQCHSAAHVAELMIELVERGVLANHSMNASGVLRLTPPAILEDNEVDLFFTAFDDALAAVAARA